MRHEDVGPLLATMRELDSPTREEIQAHLATCPECQVRYRAYQAQDQQLASLCPVRTTTQWQQGVRARAHRQRPSRSRRLSPQAGLLAVVLAVVLSVSLTAAASAQALPGQPLYPVKRSVEHVTAALIRDRDRQSAYLEELKERRREEARQVLGSGREASLEFEGILQQGGDGQWEVGGIPVILPPGQAFSGFRPGDEVLVDGQAGGGELVVQQIRLRHRHGEPGPGVAEDTPTATATPSQTSGPSMGGATGTPGSGPGFQGGPPATRVPQVRPTHTVTPVQMRQAPWTVTPWAPGPGPGGQETAGPHHDGSPWGEGTPRSEDTATPMPENTAVPSATPEGQGPGLMPTAVPEMHQPSPTAPPQATPEHTPEPYGPRPTTEPGPQMTPGPGTTLMPGPAPSTETPHPPGPEATGGGRR